MSVPRAYNPGIRAATAAKTHERIVEAARGLLPGASDIPVDRIARAAGCSVQTLYTHFGSKRGLLMAVIDAAQRDAGLYAGFDRVWRSPDGETALRRMLEATCSLWDRAWPIVEFSERVRRSDPEIGTYLREVDGYRRTHLRSITDRIAAEGRLASGHDASSAADLAFALSTPPVFDELVHTRGWPLDRATAAIVDTIAGGVINPTKPAVVDPPADWSSVLQPATVLPAIGAPSSSRGAVP